MSVIAHQLSEAGTRRASDDSFVAGHHPTLAGAGDRTNGPAGQVGDRLRVHVGLLGRGVLEREDKVQTEINFIQ